VKGQVNTVIGAIFGVCCIGGEEENIEIRQIYCTKKYNSPRDPLRSVS
jgi:hypothetical protein